MEVRGEFHLQRSTTIGVDTLLMLLAVMFVSPGVYLESTSLLLFIHIVWKNGLFGASTAFNFNLPAHFTHLLPVVYGPQAINCRNPKPRSNFLRGLYLKSATDS